jgi:hypothetical protein
MIESGLTVRNDVRGVVAGFEHAPDRFGDRDVIFDDEYSHRFRFA